MTIVRLLSGPSGTDAALDLAVGPALLAAMAAEGGDPWLRIYRPSPTVAMTGRDKLLPGFDAAVQVSRAQGFVPVRRSSGGRAAAYTDQAICLDHIGYSATDLHDIKGRFAEYGELLAGALRSLGCDARMGEVAGE
ncbi:hypothetical protein EH165_01280 [Nakamurella antarctica]|uniref:BPL/LPL catalytic domain-containing protein n=1 Tax=Nakamurella antarctica TaxID=1902245 RepID=A0A3G8ZT90_9ACTN|nr:hypothetical protein [Nakamurella antarctica]AZI57001.1 hypothetical protein EH165_01280 [Nakamurella antarctica]